MPTVERRLRLPAMLEHQAPIIDSDARNKCVCAGRRFGKTTMCLKCAIQGHGPGADTGTPKFKGAASGGRIWWLAPVYSQAAGVWAALKAATSPRSNRERSLAEQFISKSEVERTIWFPGGGSISVKTADDPDNLRGFGLDGVILDETAFMREETWTQVIKPALLDRGGWAFFISTPNGMNWFYDLYESSDREDWARWQAPTWANPLIPPEAIEEMRNDPRISHLNFQQEIEALFVAAGAGMFNRESFRYYTLEEIDRETYYILRSGDDAKRVYRHEVVPFCTVDLAATTKETSHYTVISTWAVTPDADLLLLDCDRFKAEAPDIMPRLLAVNEKWRPSYIGIERVGFQVAVVQQATRNGLPVRMLEPHKDKVARALTAVAMCEQHKVFFPRGEAWTKPLEDETISFPEGEYDDFVDTFSYAAGEVVSSRFEQVVVPLGLPQRNPWSIR